ncbi:MAG: 2Fe-2S iron-sulfur cluster-binding protein, partial [Coriobacteriales bacterium]
MSELLHITIDGKDCTCEKGEYLWDVAKRNGIPIPVLCRSDAFPEHRACCRVCIVEVEIRGRTKVVTSCVYPVEQECEVRTNSDRIKEERSVVLGLLAARAPEAQRVTFHSQAMGNEGLERLITLDGEKCVLCGLCVQACDSLE